MAGGTRLLLKMIHRGLAAEDAFQVNAEQAAELLAQLVALGLIEPVSPKPYSQSRVLNSHPVAKPLPTPPQQDRFSERQRKYFCSSSWSESAVLFGSMLSETERRGDVDVAIEALRHWTKYLGLDRTSAWARQERKRLLKLEPIRQTWRRLAKQPHQLYVAPFYVFY